MKTCSFCFFSAASALFCSKEFKSKKAATN